MAARGTKARSIHATCSLSGPTHSPVGLPARDRSEVTSDELDLWSASTLGRWSDVDGPILALQRRSMSPLTAHR